MPVFPRQAASCSTHRPWAYVPTHLLQHSPVGPVQSRLYSSQAGGRGADDPDRLATKSLISAGDPIQDEGKASTAASLVKSLGFQSLSALFTQPSAKRYSRPGQSISAIEPVPTQTDEPIRAEILPESTRPIDGGLHPVSPLGVEAGDSARSLAKETSDTDISAVSQASGDRDDKMNKNAPHSANSAESSLVGKNDMRSVVRTIPGPLIRTHAVAGELEHLENLGPKETTQTIVRQRRLRRRRAQLLALQQERKAQAGHNKPHWLGVTAQKGNAQNASPQPTSTGTPAWGVAAAGADVGQASEAIKDDSQSSRFRKVTFSQTQSQKPAAQNDQISGAPAPTTSLTHVGASGEAHMVDVMAKPSTHRVATAHGFVRFSNPEPFRLISENSNKKGDVLGTARIAGIMAAKRCADLIPLCHPLVISKVTVDVRLNPPMATSPLIKGQCDHGAVTVEATVECFGPTGVEMEALTAASVACLTVYDMCKAVDRMMNMNNVRVVFKDGGRSGKFTYKKWVDDKSRRE